MSEPFLGEIRLFGGNFAPRNWALCTGQLLAINQYTALFSLLGTTYGGNGQTTFGVPDLQGRLPVGQGQGGGHTNRVIGQTGGQESVTLTTPEIPNHVHALNASTADASTDAVGGSVLPGKVGGSFYTLNDGSTPPPTAVTMSPAACGSAGNSQAHSNLMPTLCVSYIIALQGLYPSRN